MAHFGAEGRPTSPLGWLSAPTGCLNAELLFIRRSDLVSVLDDSEAGVASSCWHVCLDGPRVVGFVVLLQAGQQS